MQSAPYGGGTVNYEPNTIAGGIPKEAPVMPGEHYHIEGDAVRKSITLTDNFEQAGERYRSPGKVDQDHIMYYFNHF